MLRSIDFRTRVRYNVGRVKILELVVDTMLGSIDFRTRVRYNVGEYRFQN